MSPAALLALLALSGPAWPGHPEHHEPPPPPPSRPTAVCAPDVVASFDRLDDALRHLAGEIDEERGRGHERHERAELRDDVHEAMERARAARLAACLAAAVPVVVAPPPPPPPPVMAPGEERKLVDAIRREPFDDGRLGVLTAAVRGTCVTSEQARELVGAMTFSSGRIDALRALAPRIIDRASAWHVLDVLTFDSDKAAARQILAAAPPTPVCS